MADTKSKMTSSGTTSSRPKRQAKNAAVEDPYATAQVRAIIDPEESDLVTAKLDEIKSTGATVSIAAAVEGSIERIISVGGSPAAVGQVRNWLCEHELMISRDTVLFLAQSMEFQSKTRLKKRKMRSEDHQYSPFESFSQLYLQVHSLAQITPSSIKSA